MKWLIVVVRVRVPLGAARACALALVLAVLGAVLGPEAALLLARALFGLY